FNFIVYSLVSVFGNVGKAIAIVLLVVQIGSSGGTFPIQVTPTCGSKERVVFLAVLQTGKALFDCTVLHRGNPKAAHRFLAARHF
ncbi:hypothetical protein ACTPEF_26650, partial [Clostridioides difficile]